MKKLNMLVLIFFLSTIATPVFAENLENVSVTGIRLNNNDGKVYFSLSYLVNAEDNKVESKKIIAYLENTNENSKVYDLLFQALVKRHSIDVDVNIQKIQNTEKTSNQINSVFISNENLGVNMDLYEIKRLLREMKTSGK